MSITPRKKKRKGRRGKTKRRKGRRIKKKATVSTVIYWKKYEQQEFSFINNGNAK